MGGCLFVNTIKTVTMSNALRFCLTQLNQSFEHNWDAQNTSNNGKLMSNATYVARQCKTDPSGDTASTHIQTTQKCTSTPYS
jgi:hypothetical protein